MSILRKIKILHLEPTDVCQLACPLCSRETDLEFNKHGQHHLTVSQIQKYFSDTDIRQLDKVFMCGDYGDPAAGKNTIEIYRWLRSINPTVVLGMNTNGALQNTAWWQEIASIMTQPKDYVVFSIDGLADTNHLYRVNCNWTKLIDNASAFINAGGPAHWDMLVYRHNQHQVDSAEQLARDMGFKWFRAKISKRPFINHLEFPIGWQHPQSKPGEIHCQALEESSIYIDAQGRISPCCWLGNRQSNFVTDFEKIKVSWGTDTPNPTCAVSCTTDKNKTRFKNQWQRETQLC
jgi:MoaA/NifB/PqqE/SkfB family radical SAM enzyme